MLSFYYEYSMSYGQYETIQLHCLEENYVNRFIGRCHERFTKVLFHITLEDDQMLFRQHLV